MATTNRKGTRTATPNAGSPLQTVAAGATTFEGAPAFTRDSKSELFLLGVSSFFGEDTFYEKGGDRAARFVALVQKVAAEDPAWIRAFIPWLRKQANIRTAAIVAAVEAAKVLVKTPTKPGEVGPGRQLLLDTFTRADEPAEALAYWLKTYGRSMPGAIRRGIADGASRFYTQRNFIKWDGDSKAVRLADVIELCHPTPRTAEQSALFKYILDSRRGTPEIPAALNMVQGRDAIMKLSAADKAKLLNGDEVTRIPGLPMVHPATVLESAGMTWEQVSSWGKFTAKTWETLIPSMGYMALLRNLRNFQEAGISAAATKMVVDKLSDPEEVAKSRQLPFRFLSAYMNAEGAQWALALETALQLSTANIPALPGRTLVLVDVSGSMVVALSPKSKMRVTTMGALFGVALAAKGNSVDLYGFDNNTFKHEVKKGSSILRGAEAFDRKATGGGTETTKALKSTWAGHDRVIIITDEQTFGPNRGDWQGNVGDQVPEHVPVYAFNMVGYAPAMLDTSATRHQLGGLTDHTFSMIPLIEAGQRAQWPWEE